MMHMERLKAERVLQGLRNPSAGVQWNARCIQFTNSSGNAGRADIAAIAQNGTTPSEFRSPPASAESFRGQRGAI
jgi:hypothetical protein